MGAFPKYCTFDLFLAGKILAQMVALACSIAFRGLYAIDTKPKRYIKYSLVNVFRQIL
jgi:hypothetical protein